MSNENEKIETPVIEAPTSTPSPSDIGDTIADAVAGTNVIPPARQSLVNTVNEVISTTQPKAVRAGLGGRSKGMTTSASIKDAKQTETAAQEYVKSVQAAPGDFREFNELDAIFDSSIIARPLHMPDTLKIKHNNPHYVYRWINFKGQGGQWFQRMLAAGYTPARPDEVESLHPEVQKDDGRIIIGDLMLCKIPRDIYAAVMKHNYQEAVSRVSQKGAVNKAQGEAGRVMNESGAPSNVLNDKVQFFNPTDKDMSGFGKS